ncbi:MAG: hypothetical protein KDD46_07590 [Bdellovibrionales bacterium]|nr:hypothetical protein [Bdellovibrionales bacterium]
MNVILHAINALKRFCFTYVLLIRNRPLRKNFIHWFENQSISVGSSSQNELILLDSAISDHVGKIEQDQGALFWVEKQGVRKKISYKGIHIGSFHVFGWKMWQVALFFGCSALLFLHFPQVIAKKQDELVQEFTLPAKEKYGNLMDGETRVAQISFYFTLEQVEAVQFIFTPGNLQSDKDLYIFINDKQVTSVEECLGNWGREQRMILNKEEVQLGVNRVSFVYQGDQNHPWGVRNLYVSRHNPSDQKNAQELFLIAKKMYIEKFAKPGNLLRAKKLIHKIKKDHAAEVVNIVGLETLGKDIDQALSSLQNRYLRDARLLVRNKQLIQARRYYQRIMQELIDPMDPLRVTIQNEMASAGVLDE